MGFIQEEPPPIIKNVIQEIEKRGAQVSSEEFREIFYKLRFKSKDVFYYKIWLKNRGYIEIGKRYEIKLNKPENLNGIYLKCYECGYEWIYKGKQKRAKCPYCKYRHKDVWIKVYH